MHNDIFKGDGSFEDDLYTGMVKYSSKVLTQPMYLDEDIFLGFYVSILIYDRELQVSFQFFIIQCG